MKRIPAIVKAKRKQMPYSKMRIIFDKANHICSICGEETRFGGLYDTPFDNFPKCGSVDHIIPYSLGGTDDMENLRWTCKSCNCSRGNRA